MKKITLTAAVLGFVGVALGAFGAHALKPTLAAQGTLETWKTAVFYQLVHAVAILALGLAHTPARDAWWPRTGLCWIIGCVLFSGSLYWLSLGGPRWLGPITPLGGLAFLLGWGFLIPTVLTSQTNAPKAP